MTFDVDDDDDAASSSGGAETAGDTDDPTGGPMGPGGATCGDGIVGGDEICDGDDLDGKSCSVLGLGEGVLGCSDDCSAFDSSACSDADPCGNGTIDPGEICDGAALGGQSCASLGLPDGELGCSDDCSAYDPSGCAEADPCGNDMIDPGEVCDGTALGGLSCAS
ncbi:MAG: hypothetical protein AB1Z98_01670, partial [Nannocystaceae bacterium]